MADHAERFHILTGGPGSGKSTLIAALRRAGHFGSIEGGRGIIRDQIAIGGNALPWRDSRLFAELMLCWAMRSYRMAERQTGHVFFDRGLPDGVGYLRLMGLPVPSHMMKAVETFRYNRRVFVAPPWPAIFRQDEERKQTLDEADRTYEALIRTYNDFGYELVELPKSTVGERVQCALDQATIARRA